MNVLRLVLCALLANCAYPASGKEPPSEGGAVSRKSKGINFYSRAREIEMGKELSRDIERSARLIEDPVVLEYVNRVGLGIVHQSASLFTLRIRIIRDEDANSLTLPGGYIYIHSGLILAAVNEAELAAALAHEIGHVAARHYVRQASCGDILSFAAIPLLLVGGWPGLLAHEGTNLGGTLVMKHLSRRAEAEADRLGIQYLYEAGYDPTAFVDLLERTSPGDHRPSRSPGFLSEHPSPSNRVRAAQKQIQRDLLPRGEYLLQTSEFDVIHERLAAIARGTPVPWITTTSPSGSDERPVLRRRP